MPRFYGRKIALFIVVVAFTGLHLGGLTLGDAYASPVTYELAIYKSLPNSSGGSGAIGSTTTPIVFHFTVDSNAPNNSGTTDIGLYYGGASGVSVGSEAVFWDFSIVQTVYRPANPFVSSTFNADTAGTLGGTINGRTLRFGLISLYNFYGPPFLTGIELPLNADFANGVEQGYARLLFAPLPGDPEYLTGQPVMYEGYFSPNEFSLTIVGAAEALLSQLATDVAGVGPGRSLADKVALAQTYYAAPNVQATCTVLTGFVNEVRAQRGKKLTTELADELTAEAQAIMTVIGCN